ncbi:hypothetical protein V6N12_032110 [Hibiscus sabdariffa]|uniref:Uncharacterized protein n=1 Tax=Hibiscus sabdariffa TaxID=183260 RepID=A0ABR2CCI5_9ROSI
MATVFIIFRLNSLPKQALCPASNGRFEDAAQNPTCLTKLKWWMLPTVSTSAVKDLLAGPKPSRCFTATSEPEGSVPRKTDPNPPSPSLLLKFLVMFFNSTLEP